MIHPSVLVREADALASDFTNQFESIADKVLAVPEEFLRGADCVVLVGSGDSHHAACAGAMAFETFADIDCQSTSSLRLDAYGGERLRRRASLVVAVSAGGETPQLIRAATQARRLGARTIAVTGSPTASLASAVDQVILVDLPAKAPSPGIRSHQASLLGLLLLALRLADCRGSQTETLRSELAAVATAIAAASSAAKQSVPEVVDALVEQPTIVILGSGPAWGSAQFAAAKLTEAAAFPAHAQDVEEWLHVERFTRPVEGPIVVLAPRGRSFSRTADIASVARDAKRRVIAVAHPDDARRLATDVLIPAPIHVREQYSPLALSIFAPYLAAGLAERLGRSPFLGDAGV